MSTLGRSVRLFLVDGNPNGVMTAEVINWTGHLLLAPVSKLPDVFERGEMKKTGVYLLFGELSELGGRRPVYIGESDNVGKRITQHTKDDARDFDRFCVITSKDLNLTKAHARYLENRLSSIARSSERAEVLNKNEPPLGNLPESDVADMEYFIDQIRIVLPVLGFDILKDKFLVPAHIATEIVLEQNTALEIVPLTLRASRKGLQARAIEKDGEIKVLKGSLADRYPEYAMNQYSGLRDRLITEGILVPEPFLEFTEDTLFTSPSAAAAVIYGRNANGRTSWVLANMNRTLKEHQEKEAAE